MFLHVVNCCNKKLQGINLYPAVIIIVFFFPPGNFRQGGCDMPETLVRVTNCQKEGNGYYYSFISSKS